MQIFHLLDLTLFVMLKQEEKYHLAFRDLGTTVDFAYNICLKMAKRLIPSNLWAAFRAIGINFDIESIPCHIVFHQEKLRESKGFIELWNLDHPLQSLTPRRQNSQFGWINKLK
jgi:hypothetical protein